MASSCRGVPLVVTDRRGPILSLTLRWRPPHPSHAARGLSRDALGRNVALRAGAVAHVARSGPSLLWNGEVRRAADLGTSSAQARTGSWGKGAWRVPASAPSPSSRSHHTAEEGAAGWGLRRPRRKGGSIKKGKVIALKSSCL